MWGRGGSVHNSRQENKPIINFIFHSLQSVKTHRSRVSNCWFESFSVAALCFDTCTMLHFFVLFFFFYAEAHFICLPRGAGNTGAHTEESKEKTANQKQALAFKLIQLAIFVCTTSTVTSWNSVGTDIQNVKPDVKLCGSCKHALSWVPTSSCRTVTKLTLQFHLPQGWISPQGSITYYCLSRLLCFFFSFLCKENKKKHQI